jgi:hypothetical protein
MPVTIVQWPALSPKHFAAEYTAITERKSGTTFAKARGGKALHRTGCMHRCMGGHARPHITDGRATLQDSKEGKKERGNFA